MLPRQIPAHLEQLNVTAIIDKGYRVTPEQIEHMAREAAKGYAAGETYLRCLIVAAQESKRRGLRAVNEAHGAFYPAVLRGVGGEPKDAHKRSVFARTAASTLRSYVKRGGKLSDIDVSTATKGSLRKFDAPAESGDRNERSAARATDALIRAVRKMAKKNAALARRLVAEAVDALKASVPAGTRAEQRAEAARVH